MRDDIRKLYQHSSHYLAGLLCSMALGFVSFPVFTRLFSVGEYGLIDFVQRFVLLATALAKMGLQNAALRFYDGRAFSSDRKAAEEYYSTLCFGTALTALAATVAFVIVVAVLPKSLIEAPFKWLLYLAAPLIFLRGMESILWAFLRIQERTKAYNVYAFALRAGTIAGIFVFLFLIERSVRGFFAGMLAAEAVIVAVLLALLFKNHLLRTTKFDVAFFLRASAFGLPLIIYELASIVLDSGDRVLVRYFLGSTSLGYYSVAYTISGYIQDLILAPLNLALLPIYMNLWRNDGPERTTVFLNQGLDFFLMFAAGVFAIIAVTSREALIVLASSKYQPAASLIPILACGLLIYTTHVFLCAGLLIHRKTLVMAKSVFYSAVLNIAMNCVLLPRIGLPGAAIATLVSYAFAIWLMSRASFGMLRLKIEVLALMRYVAASAVTVVAVSQSEFGGPLLNLLGRGFLGMVLYGGIMCLTDSRPREFIAMLGRKRPLRVPAKECSGIGAGADAMKNAAVDDEPAGAQAGSSVPRHVLFLIDQVLALDGGGESTILKIVRALPRDRYRPSVGTFQLNPQLVDQFPCPVIVFRLQRTYDWNAIKSALHLRRFIRSNRVTIVHTFFETSDLWGGLVAKLSGCPLLISSRRDMGIQRSAKHSLAYRVAGSMFDQVHTVSDAVRDFAIQHDGLDPDKVITLHNGVDMQRVAAMNGAGELRKALGLENASHLIVDVGWIRPVKGTDTLIRAAAIVCREFPKAVFLIIGDHDEELYFRELQALIASFGLSWNFRFLGSRDDVFPVLKMCDVFCHTSRSDGLSNALLEAMACGLPCVATAVGGNPEAIEEGESGFLVPSDDPAAAAESLLCLLRDPDHARRMGERGKRIASTRFSAELMVGKLVTSYDGLLNRRHDLDA